MAVLLQVRLNRVSTAQANPQIVNHLVETLNDRQVNSVMTAIILILMVVLAVQRTTDTLVLGPNLMFALLFAEMERKPLMSNVMTATI